LAQSIRLNGIFFSDTKIQDQKMRERYEKLKNVCKSLYRRIYQHTGKQVSGGIAGYFEENGERC
jgi:hypothetical protein